MKKLLLVGSVMVASVGAASAATLENTLFTCDGVLKDQINGVYSIDQVGGDDEYPMSCMFDKGPISNRILSVCRVGKQCVVSAKGSSGNRNEHFIQKVFEVQHGQ